MQLVKFSRLAVFCLLLTVLSVGSLVHAQSKVAPWEKFEFSKQKLTLEQLKGLNLTELKYLRGILFGRHGRVFQEKVIQDYLKSRPWYKPNPRYHVSQLNAIERHNMDLIKEAEWRQHKHVQPGDLRFYRNRLITLKELGPHSLAELRIMRAEIEAGRGKRFPAEPWLQNFFDERYWYQPGTKYNPRSLSAIERKNMALIAAQEQKQRHLKLSPGAMGAFQKQLIHETMLRGLSLYELRLLRNEIYARRGQRFRTVWLDQHFGDQSWYRPLPDFRTPVLSPIEQKNVAMIVKYENRLHRELSTKPLTSSLLKDLPLDDARKLRNEIYARRGRRFKEPWLQKYFASFAWYRPNPRFHDASLNAIEKRNAAMIRAYEKQAESLMSAVAA